ncbi:MAG: hypothetical protein ACO20H_09815 [Bacteriovoracaceae bacterium]
MSVKTIDIYNPKVSSKVDPKVLEQKQDGKSTNPEGFDKLLQSIVEKNPKKDQNSLTRNLAQEKLSSNKKAKSLSQQNIGKQEKNGDLEKPFFLKDIPEGREVVHIGKAPISEKKVTPQKGSILKVDDVLRPKTESLQTEKQALKEASPNKIKTDRKPFFFTNQKIEDFESKFSENNLNQNKALNRGGFFPKKTKAINKLPSQVSKLDSSFEREALVDKDNVLPFRKAISQQTYFPEVKIDKKIQSEENVKVEPFNKFQQRDEMFFDPRPEVNITKTETISKAPLQLSQLQGTKSEVIEQISDYIMRNSFGNQKSLTVTVSHKDIGQFQVEAHRNGDPGDIKLNIRANTEEGRLFFKANQQELVQKLSDKGIFVFDFKVSNFSSPTNQSSKNDGNFNFQQNHSNNAYSEDSQNPQYNEGQERRKELWEKYKEQLGA